MFYPEQTPKYDFPVIYTEEEKLTKKAEYDALTGLPNRFYIMDELTKVFQSGTQAQYYVAMIDIDNFKNINDTYGHNIGDDALKVLARTIIENAKKTVTSRKKNSTIFARQLPPIPSAPNDPVSTIRSPSVHANIKTDRVPKNGSLLSTNSYTSENVPEKIRLYVKRTIPEIRQEMTNLRYYFSQKYHNIFTL